MDHSEYLQRRAELMKIRTDSFESFDKAVLSLATGSLALTIAFLDKIGSPFDSLTFWLIVATWIALVFAILANLASYVFAKLNMDRKIRELDATYTRQIVETKTDCSTEKMFWQRKATGTCNTAAFVAFSLSVAIFTWYVIEIQRHNFGQLRRRQEVVKSMKKTAGVTEVKASVGKQVTTKHSTETQRADSDPDSTKATKTTQPCVRGQTEAPVAVSKPVGTQDASTKSGQK